MSFCADASRRMGRPPYKVPRSAAADTDSSSLVTVARTRHACSGPRNKMPRRAQKPHTLTLVVVARYLLVALRHKRRRDTEGPTALNRPASLAALKPKKLPDTASIQRRAIHLTDMRINSVAAPLSCSARPRCRATRAIGANSLSAKCV